MKQENPQMEQEVRSVYQRMVSVMLDFTDLKDLEKTIHPDFIGYGSAAHEFFKTREDLKKMAQMQKDQLEGQGFRYDRRPVAMNFFADGSSCLILEEFDLFFAGVDHQLLLRLSSLLECIDGEWLVTHVHGSTPDPDIAEEEAFPEEGLRKKNEELEAKIRERTRELEIEAALERARAQSMMMQHSSELNSVSNVFHEQLLLLGIDSEFSFVWLPNESREHHLFWTTWTETVDGELVFHNKSISYPLDLSDPYNAACIADWESGVSVHEHFVPPKDIETFFVSWKELLEGASHLKAKFFPEGIYYTEAFMKYGCFGIDIRRPLSEEEKSVLHRFALEFERAYTRFLDLKKAEAQAREAEIEAALERVRAATMAMHKTEDISRVAVVVLEQLEQLKLNFIQAWIDVFHLDKGYIDIWFSPLEGVYEEPRHLQLPSAIFEDTSIKSWKAGNKFSYVSLKSKEEVDALVAACDAGSGTDYFGHFQEILKLDRLEFVDANHKYGTVSKSSFGKATKEEEEILHRFARVFEQTYTRFLDLQKAESQARQAEIEVALERVRSRSMGMQGSGELKEVIRVIFDELAGLKINAEHAGIVVDFSPGQDWNFWVAETQDIPSKITLPYLGSLWDRQYTEAKEKGTEFFTTELSFDEKNAFYEELLKHIPGLTAKAREFYLTCPGLAISTVVQEDIGLYMENFYGTPYTEEENTILKRFGKVFQQTYTRFLDLQKAEAQAREAQIETALERVRSRTMGMQSSDELREVVLVINEQLQQLHFDSKACNIIILDKETGDATYWVSGFTKDIYPVSYQVPYLDHPYYEALLEPWKKGKPYAVYAYEGAEKKNFDKRFFSETGFKEVPEEARKEMMGLPDVTLSTAYFANGAIQVLGPEALSDEKAVILKRFANVFEQTYTRFLDLQKAEAQAREAQIELGLEKVRTRAMAMQRSSELSDLVDTVFQELTRLDFALNWCIINIIDAPNACNTVWAANVETGKPPESYHMLFEDYPFHHAMMQGYQERASKFIYTIEGAEKKVYDDYLFSQTEFRKTPKQAQEASRAMEKYVCSFTFSNFGGLQTVGSEPLS
ncbi:MAG: nuclear transport factor 2 family protein, partial [Robiginitalea sp.]